MNRGQLPAMEPRGQAQFRRKAGKLKDVRRDPPGQPQCGLRLSESGGTTRVPGRRRGESAQTKPRRALKRKRAGRIVYSAFCGSVSSCASTQEGRRSSSGESSGASAGGAGAASGAADSASSVKQLTSKALRVMYSPLSCSF